VCKAGCVQLQWNVQGILASILLTFSQPCVMYVLIVSRSRWYGVICGTLVVLFFGSGLMTCRLQAGLKQQSVFR
jgi:hypothetical protein